MKKTYLNPNGGFRQRWDAMTTYFVLYTAIVLPYRLALEPKAGPWMIQKDFVMDVVFIADFFLNCITAFHRKGELITDHKLILIQYLRSWALIDFISTFPFDWVLQVDTSSSQGNDASLRATKLARLSRIAKILRLLRLMRVARFARVLKKFEVVMNMKYGLLLACKFVSMVLIVAHWLGCFFLMIPVLSKDDYGRFPPTSWVNDLQVESGRRITTTGDDNTTTVAPVLIPLAEASTNQKYVSCFYWSITTMTTIGFGDITPGDEAEKLFTIVAMLVGAGVFAYGITNMVTVVSELNLHERAFRQQMDEMHEWMIFRGIPKHTRMRIRQFMNFKKTCSRAYFYNEKDLFEHLTPSLAKEVRQHAHCLLLQSSRLFQQTVVLTAPPSNMMLESPSTALLTCLRSQSTQDWESPDQREIIPNEFACLQYTRLLEYVAVSAESRVYSINDALLQPGDRIPGIFCVLKGVVRRKFMEIDSFNILPGGYFGQVALLDPQTHLNSGRKYMFSSPNVAHSWSKRSLRKRKGTSFGHSSQGLDLNERSRTSTQISPGPESSQNGIELGVHLDLKSNSREHTEATAQVGSAIASSDKDQLEEIWSSFDLESQRCIPVPAFRTSSDNTQPECPSAERYIADSFVDVMVIPRDVCVRVAKKFPFFHNRILRETRLSQLEDCTARSTAREAFNRWRTRTLGSAFGPILEGNGAASLKKMGLVEEKQNLCDKVEAQSTKMAINQRQQSCLDYKDLLLADETLPNVAHDKSKEAQLLSLLQSRLRELRMRNGVLCRELEAERFRTLALRQEAQLRQQELQALQTELGKAVLA